MKNGSNIQTVFVTCATEVGRWVLNSWVVNPSEVRVTGHLKTGVVSDEDPAEIWETVKKESIENVRGNKKRSSDQTGGWEIGR